jgi:hypothetical protein
MVILQDNAFAHQQIHDNFPNHAVISKNVTALKIPIKKTQTMKKTTRVLNLNLIKSSLKKANGFKQPPKSAHFNSTAAKTKFEHERQRAFNQLMDRIQDFYRHPRAVSPIKEEKIKDDKFDYSLYEIDASFLFTSPKTKSRPSLKMKFKRVDRNYEMENLESFKNQRLIDDNLRRMIDNFASNVETVVNEIQKEKRLSVGK